MPNIQIKRGLSTALFATNPILVDGEIVFETDTKKFKLGDGSTSWNNLPYAVLPNSGVSISGINIISGSGNFNTLTVSSVPVSVSGHSHTSSNITDFNSSVSGLLPTIANSGDNRILTSTGSSVGINAEANLTFDGTNLNLNNQTASTIASFDSSKNLVSLTTATYPSLTELSYVKGVTSALQTQIDSKAATSTTITAGSGLAGGGSLAANRTIDIGQGDGITISADSIAVDSTVIRTTGVQTMSAVKTFSAQTVFASGTAASPGISILGDTDTGIGQLSANGTNSLSIMTSGVERLTVNSGGNVGIGVSPSFRLDVLGSANTVAKIKTSAAGSFGCLQIHNANTNGETSIGFRDDSDSDASSWVIGKSVGGVADVFGFYYNGNRLVIDTSGNVGIGSTSPQTALQISKNADGALLILSGAQSANTQSILFRNPYHTNNSTAGTAFIGAQDTGSQGGNLIFATTSDSSGTSGIPSERMRITSAGNVGIGSGATTPPELLSVMKDNNAGRTSILIDNLDHRLKMSCYYEAGVGQYAEIQSTNNAETGHQVLILNRQGGYVGIGTATVSYRLHVVGNASATNNITTYLNNSGGTRSRLAFQDTAVTYAPDMGSVGNNITFDTVGVERVRIGSGGRVQFFANDEKFGIQLNKGSAGTGPFIGSDGADIFTISTAGGAERVRIDASGNLLINTTSADPGGTNASSGMCLAPSSYISVSRSDGASLILNRKTTDGILAAFYQDGALEGSISVSGNTVSYNAFCGSHWAQLIDGSRPAILRGTVLETIDEMCEWPEGKSDRLARVKVSDTPRSRRVYGVFMAWDEDYAATGDMYATALGAYMVRVSGVVQSGDLLESAGDGTARTQSDDIVRSSTIGKVSSTHRVAEYDDGSYLVPCVLMCG